MKGLFKGLLFTLLLLFAVTSIMANVVQHPVKTEKHPPGYSADVIAPNAFAMQPAVVFAISRTMAVCEVAVSFSNVRKTEVDVAYLAYPVSDLRYTATSERTWPVSNLFNKRSYDRSNSDNYTTRKTEDVIIPIAEALPDKAA